MAMAVAIDTARLALELIPQAQRQRDRETGGRRRFQIHRVSAYATIPSNDSELSKQLRSPPSEINWSCFYPERKALDWQPDPDNDLNDAAVLHHLHQQAATVPLLSSVFSQSDHGNAATTLTGSALSASINDNTQGRLLSSFHHHTYREGGFAVAINGRTILLGYVAKNDKKYGFFFSIGDVRPFIAWAGPQRDDYVVFWQLQIDVIDLFSRRTHPTSRPGKRRRTAINQFLQVSHSPVVADTSRGNPLPRARRFNGVRHRPDRRTWVAEMKPSKHRTKQDFGNFKSEAEAARAVDAAFHHYGRPELLNFPDTSLQFLSTRPMAAPGLDEKAKVKFVKEEAKLLLADTAATSPLRSTHTNSLQVPESPRRCPSGHCRSLPEISWPFSCSGLDEVDDVVSPSQPWVDLGSTCDIATTGVQTDLENLNSVPNAEWGREWVENSSPLAAPLDVVNSSACEIQSKWLSSYSRSPPAPAYWRSPSPSHSQEQFAYALLEQQSTSVWSDDLLYEKVEGTIIGSCSNFENM